ncbi:MAG TPA: histidinol-phosphate transaminase [Thermoleophilaceae bacterium]|nr:histidinol-phosphate transaminase [Thermoleophilaceae bacterium]
MSIEFAARMREVAPYPKAATYAHGGNLVKLASNETPWGPAQPVLDAIAEVAGSLNRYPDPGGTQLRKRLAERYDTNPERIALGNGSCDILLGAAQALLEPGAEIVYAWPSFSMYPHLAALTGARAITVPLTEDGRHDLDAMLAEITAATRICVICNPNNPTGTALPLEEIAGFAERLPSHVALIVDEAYVEFNLLQDADDSLDLLKRHNNVVLLRTFSKVYGLCGLRVGYALCPEGFRDAVDRIRQPFSVNSLAQAAAAEALLHQHEVARRVERTAIERLHVESELESRGLAVAPSQANFSWVAVEDEEAVLTGLEERGVIVRGGGALGDPGHVRVTYGTREENDRFLAALDDVLNK